MNKSFHIYTRTYFQSISIQFCSRLRKKIRIRHANHEEQPIIGQSCKVNGDEGPLRLQITIFNLRLSIWTDIEIEQKKMFSDGLGCVCKEIQPIRTQGQAA